AGVKVRTEKVRMNRWRATEWSLDLIDGAQAGPVRTASYIPYSGQTGAGGVEGPLVYIAPGATVPRNSLVGKIAVFDVPLTVITIGAFELFEYEGRRYDPAAQLDPSTVYKRPYLNTIIPVLDKLRNGGAAGAIGILDYPSDGADGSYFPYDGNIRGVPGLYVDRAT